MKGIGAVKSRILLVEDDEMIREGISDYLQGREHIYEVDCAATGQEGLGKIKEGGYDLILLDVMLPGMSGFILLRELRKSSEVPVIMITAKVREEDRLRGYELGCDDYVCKPFLLSELYAKVGAILRRSKSSDADARDGAILRRNRLGDADGGDGEKGKHKLTCGKIQADLKMQEVWVNERKVDLTPKEFDLLITLLRHPNQIFTRELLLDLVWGMDYEGTDRTVDNHIKKLRKSLGVEGRQIKTIYSKGYKISEKG